MSSSPSGRASYTLYSTTGARRSTAIISIIRAGGSRPRRSACSSRPFATGRQRSDISFNPAPINCNCRAGNEAIERDFLSKLLWPGRFEAHARASLRQCLLDLGLLIAFIAAEPMSGVYMAGLIAACIPVGILLHRCREAARLARAWPAIVETSL